MNYVDVTFGKNGTKRYRYKTRLKPLLGAEYRIIADGHTSYSCPVRVVGISATNDDCNYAGELREITSMTLINAKRPDDHVEHVYFNESKGTTAVVWKNGLKTVVHLQPGDTFDREKGLAMCYVKHLLGNTGSFNEVYKKWCKPED